MRASPFLALGTLLWAGVTVVANPCKPATSSSSSVSSSASLPSSSSVAPSSSSSSSAPSASPSIVCTVAGIQNADFSSGLDGWDTVTYSDNSAVITASTDCGDGVASCAQLYSIAGQGGQSGQATIGQAGIPVTDGAAYTLTYQYRITALGSGIMGVIVNGVTTAGGVVGTVDEWTTYSHTLTASGATISVAPFQRSYGGSMTIQVTDVQLETCSSSGGSSGGQAP